MSDDVVVASRPAFWAEGHLVLPDEPGKPLVFKFMVRFKRLKTTEQRELDKRINENRRLVREHMESVINGKTMAEFVPAITDKELLEKVLVDWKGFKNADGGVVIYTEAARDQVIEDYPGMEAAMARAYLDSRDPSQDLKALEKNSEALSVTS